MRVRIRRRLSSRSGRGATSRSDRGASAVEYGLLVAAVAALIVGAAFAFGNVVGENFTKTSNCLVARGNGDPFPGCPDAP
jgi:pilus assembly protein Flp/PilA